VILHTASEIISLARKLENESAKFYEELSGLNNNDEAIFLSFSSENKKNVTQIERAYYGTISDAIEGRFAFNLEADEYNFETGISTSSGYAGSLGSAINIENLIIRFYSDAATQSQTLMADMPRIFKLVARRRAERIKKLESLLKSAQPGT
jgi:rubrerythrin